jgi:uncharacterized membrane protein YhaH (DUF805 family)
VGAYADALLRYFSFFGRTSRSQYWLFQLFELLVLAAAFGVDYLCHRKIAGYPAGVMFGLASLFHVIPQITITVRRLHDIGRSGFWYLLCFVPFGALLVLVWTCFASEIGSNAYGDSPTSEGRRRPPASPMRRAVRSNDYAQETLERIEARQTRVSGRFSS